METTQLFLVVIGLIILTEASYLVWKVPRTTIARKHGRPILVDTSVLIDGRILAVASSGFIGDTLVIPRSVIGELQFLADNADHDKRARARHGLDVVTELQAMSQVNVEIMQDGSKAEEGVDERLLKLAKIHGAAVCTIDFNLNKVAAVEGIAVLNVNELAQSLRMAYLPGEKMLLEMVQKGQDSHQAVGYLTDGTMVVVENAVKEIGKTIEIEFIRSLQTAAGKMMFAKPVGVKQPAKPQQKPHGKKPIQPVQPVKPSRPEKPRPETRAAATPTPKPPVVFHSDKNDHHLAKRQNNQRPARHNNRQAGKSQPQRHSSQQREAALIELVDKQ